MSNSNHKRQKEAASELSDRAAESVDRRYDATKETLREREATEATHDDDEDRDEQKRD